MRDEPRIDTYQQGCGQINPLGLSRHASASPRQEDFARVLQGQWNLIPMLRRIVQRICSYPGDRRPNILPGRTYRMALPVTEIVEICHRIRAEVTAVFHRAVFGGKSVRYLTLVPIQQRQAGGFGGRPYLEIYKKCNF